MNSSIKGNHSRGGAIFYYGAGSFSVFNCTFTNSSANKSGGAIYHTGAGNVSVVNCTFTNSSANKSGGAIFADGNAGSVTIER